jgi:hypothetical protein
LGSELQCLRATRAESEDLFHENGRSHEQHDDRLDDGREVKGYASRGLHRSSADAEGAEKE